MAVAMFQFKGIWGSGTEIWQHSLVCDFAGVDPIDLEEAAQWAKTGFETAYEGSAWQDLVPAGQKYTEVSAAQVLNLSTGTLTAAFHEPMTADLIGDATTGVALPLQCAVAVTLVAGTRPNGTPLRGRFYLPAPQGTVAAYSSAGQLTTTAQTACLDFVEALLNELTSTVAFRAPQVWSRSLATTQTIEEIRVGRIVDTIRSRRNALDESYASRTL